MQPFDQTVTAVCTEKSISTSRSEEEEEDQKKKLNSAGPGYTYTYRTVSSYIWSTGRATVALQTGQVVWCRSQAAMQCL